jgi:hypothetical protein
MRAWKVVLKYYCSTMIYIIVDFNITKKLTNENTDTYSHIAFSHFDLQRGNSRLWGESPLLN